jgi:DNA polymerase-1
MVYGCGFAAQHTVYDYVLAGEGESDIIEGIALSRDELAATGAMLPDGWAITYNSVTEAEPLENALALCKRQITRVAEKLDGDGYEFDRIELFLTGKGNYRDEIATLRPYKGNRLLMEKPIHYKSIRRYLVDRWMAKVINGWEADDEVSMLAASLDYDPERVMIVSQDKDLRTVPGLLFNYRRNTYEFITPAQARGNFYRQILVGDLTDNIGGVYRCGKAKAEKLITDDMTERQMYEAVLAECRDSLGRKSCPYADKDPEAVILELGRLLHMARSPTETVSAGYWIPPQ